MLVQENQTVQNKLDPLTTDRFKVNQQQAKADQKIPVSGRQAHYPNLSFSKDELDSVRTNYKVEKK